MFPRKFVFVISCYTKTISVKVYANFAVTSSIRKTYVFNLIKQNLTKNSDQIKIYSSNFSNYTTMLLQAKMHEKSRNAFNETSKDCIPCIRRTVLFSYFHAGVAPCDAFVTINFIYKSCIRIPSTSQLIVSNNTNHDIIG